MVAREKRETLVVQGLLVLLVSKEIGVLKVHIYRFSTRTSNIEFQAVYHLLVKF